MSDFMQRFRQAQGTHRLVMEIDMNIEADRERHESDTDVQASYRRERYERDVERLRQLDPGHKLVVEFDADNSGK